MEIRPPIFLVGTSRSGKSLLGNFLAIHQDCCWFSNYSEKCPRFPVISTCHRLISWPFLGALIKKSIVSKYHYKFFPRPVEGEVLYHVYCGVPKDRIKSVNFLEYGELKQSALKLKKSVAGHIKYQGKKRFISDQSANTQRIKLINEIFPNAYIIHVIRDGRAVANEIIQRDWWAKHRVWWYGRMPQAWVEEGKDPIVMCGVHWAKTVGAVLDDRKAIGNRYLEVRYEDLTEDPIRVIRHIMQFCHLGWYQDFEKYLPKQIENKNYRWEKELTKTQIAALEEVLEGLLIRYGYVLKKKVN